MKNAIVRPGVSWDFFIFFWSKRNILPNGMVIVKLHIRIRFLDQHRWKLWSQPNSSKSHYIARLYRFTIGGQCSVHLLCLSVLLVCLSWMPRQKKAQRFWSFWYNTTEVTSIQRHYHVQHSWRALQGQYGNISQAPSENWTIICDYHVYIISNKFFFAQMGIKNGMHAIFIQWIFKIVYIFP